MQTGRFECVPNSLARNLGGSLTKPDVNMGHQILVRLRPPHSPDSFLPEEDVVQTMLHEVGFSLDFLWMLIDPICDPCFSSPITFTVLTMRNFISF